MDRCIRKRYGSARRPDINMVAILSMVMAGQNAIMVESQLIANRKGRHQARSTAGCKVSELRQSVTEFDEVT